MQIFEFQFNPKQKEDLSFDSFCYEPENVYEKRMGSIYMLGSLKNVLPQNIHFLDKLAKQIKEKFYKNVSVTSEKALKETLKKANEYLEKTAQGGDVSWLGNLAFSVITLKNFELNFTKAGELKIYLIRKGQIIDTDQKLDFGDLEPYPLKVFGNIVSGKLAENDIVLALTKSMADAFFQEKVLSDIVKISLSPNLLEEAKKIRDIFNAKGDKLSKSTGAALLIILSKEHLPRRRETLDAKKSLKVLSVKTALAPILSLLPKIKNFSIKLPKFSFKSKKIKITPPKIKIPEIVLPKKKLPKIKFPKIPEIKLNKKSYLIPLLLVFLLVGYFIVRIQSEGNKEEYFLTLQEANKDIQEAENYLLLTDDTPGAKDAANLLLLESWDTLSPIFEDMDSIPSNLEKDFLDIKEKISNRLYELNKLTLIENPEVFFQFEDYAPNKISYLNGSLYFIQNKNLLELTQGNNLKAIPSQKDIDFLGSGENLLIFSKPNSLMTLKNGGILEKQSLESLDYDFSDLSVYLNNLYFLDKNKIIKYSYSNGTWLSPQLWAESSDNFESIAVDGSVWLLKDNNEIKRYYGGNLQQTISLNIFPRVQNISQIFTSGDTSYLYLTEPEQRRIIVLDKNGNTVKQFQSESFDNIISIWAQGKTAYLLSGSKVYKLSF